MVETKDTKKDTEDNFTKVPVIKVRFMTDEEWNEFYMGDDSEFTYFIDMVEGKFAKNSTAPLDERYDLLDSIDEMFEKIRLRKWLYATYRRKFKRVKGKHR